MLHARATEVSDEQDDLIVRFETAYRRSFVPKGCRVTRFEYPRVAGGAAVECIPRGGAEVAFRLHFRGPCENLLTGASRTSTIDLLRHGGQIWWPHGPDLYRPTLPDRVGDRRSDLHLQADRWREMIGADRDLLRLLPHGMRTVDAESPSRFTMPDGSDETTARVQISLTTNYRTHAGRVYVRGGVPVYAHQKLSHGRSVVAIVSSGVERDVTGRHEVYQPPADFETAVTQAALALGRFWSPGDEAVMRRRAPRSWLPYPLIEVRSPDAVPLNLERDVRLDALFRRLAALQSTIVGCAIDTRTWSHKPAYSPQERVALRNDIRRAVRGAVEPRRQSEATTSARFAALRTLLDHELRLPKRGRATEIRAYIGSFRELERRYFEERFADEDLEAFDRLGSA